MKKSLIFKRAYQFLTFLSVIFTVGDLSIKMTTWTMNNVWCNPVLVWALCSILIAILVFIINPLYNHWGIVDKRVKGISYFFILAFGGAIIFVLPKGNCTLSTAASALPAVPKVDTPSSKPPVQTDTPLVARETPKKNLPHSEGKKANPKTAPSTAAPKYDLSHATLSGNIQIGDSDVMIVNINGVIQRQISDRLIDNMIFKMGGNHPIIEWMLQTSDWESQNVFKQIKTKLNQRGYKFADGPDLLSFQSDTIDYGYAPNLLNKPYLLLIPGTKNTQ
jgi:hypothetical protein